MFKKRHFILILAVGVVFAGILYAVLGEEDDASQAEPPAADSAIEHTGVTVPKPAAEPDSTLPAENAPEKETPAPEPEPTAMDTGAPECRIDKDCRGPRHADCIKTTCSQGNCVYDRSGCECRTSADCHDGDPCTRDHCFVPTMSCIFIPKDNCK